MAWRKEKQRMIEGHDFLKARRHDLYSARQILRFYRQTISRQLGPLFVLFSVVDFYYKPESAWSWLGLRLLVPIYIWITLRLIANYGFFRRRLRAAVFVLIVLVSAIVSFMIYQTGGTYSAATTVSIFYFSVALTTAIGRSFRDQLNRIWIRSQKQTATELAVYRRGELLKTHFPPLLRQAIESGELEIGDRTIMKGAVVGFADIVGSTMIGNVVDLETDWRLKEGFLSSATLRARECGMVVLNQVGDGFVFLANFKDSANWEDNLISFYERVTIDFQQTLMSLHKELGTIDSGIRFGVARGDVMMGWIGNSSQSYFTAMGREVNLAARLCAVAAPNEMIVSSMDSCLVESALRKHKTEQRVFTQLKGFTDDVHAIVIQPRAFSVLGNDSETEDLIESVLGAAKASARNRAS